MTWLKMLTSHKSARVAVHGLNYNCANELFVTTRSILNYKGSDIDYCTLAQPFSKEVRNSET
jgi:thymidine kinase